MVRHRSPAPAWQNAPPITDTAWIVEQLTVLAEALGTSLTAARLRTYAEFIGDLERDAIAQSIRRARECKFFPSLDARGIVMLRAKRGLNRLIAVVTILWVLYWLAAFPLEKQAEVERGWQAQIAICDQRAGLRSARAVHQVL